MIPSGKQFGSGELEMRRNRNWAFGRLAGLVLATGFAGVGGMAHASTLNASYARPCMDVWIYPFNSTPGYRSAASTFSSLGQENAFPGASFDQRDATLLIGFDTGATGLANCPTNQVTAGLGECAYVVTSAVVRIATATDFAFPYDPTYDAWDSYPTMEHPERADTDAGRAIELYGAAFRAPWTAATYYEGTSSNLGPAFGPSASPQSDERYVYPTDNVGSGLRDVSNNVRDEFDAKPFAVGHSSLTPGDYVPANTDFTFTLNVNDADVQRYLRTQLNEGRVRLVLTSLQPASSAGGPGGGEYATWFTKENIFSTGRSARLELSVQIRTVAGDANADDHVNNADLSVLLGQFGQTLAIPGTGADFNCDGVVNGSDLSVLLSNFGH